MKHMIECKTNSYFIWFEKVISGKIIGKHLFNYPLRSKILL